MTTSDVIEIITGDTLLVTIRVKYNGSPVNVTGRSYASQIRQTPSSPVVLATFSVDMSDAANGVVVLSLSPAITSTLKPMKVVFDVQETNAGVVTTIATRKAVVVQDVTR